MEVHFTSEADAKEKKQRRKGWPMDKALTTVFMKSDTVSSESQEWSVGLGLPEERRMDGIEIISVF